MIFELDIGPFLNFLQFLRLRTSGSASNFQKEVEKGIEGQGPHACLGFNRKDPF
ncbi:hypothetical protein ADICYQ_0141 [Cyclobacterium qasimii M12-11B]|uniref:Uncharacterized protein n=1 Tax=Cyclobacterium qasimii M12-11B TaxID=641524 RepID=S7VNA4_9BACT|nr:hypothetical protein ADICYQ_0141 [Cyclobacterium qasimii M12-11B]